MPVYGTGAAVTEDDLRSLVTDAGTILHERGLVDYLGHCSARAPGADRIVIKPRHSAKTRSPGRLAPADMVVVDLDGNLVQGDEAPPSEVFLHTEIYRARPDVLGIVHTHQPAATLFGTIDAELQPILHVPAVLTDGGRVPKWACPLLVNTAERGGVLAAALGGGPLVHLQGHGIVSVADDLRAATVVAVALEELARANLDVLQTGRQARAITEAELADLAHSMEPIAGRWAYYLQEIL